MQKVIDVSEHQGVIDWEKVKEAGYHAIIRCGYGSDFPGQDDNYFKRNADECVRLGIPFGVYLYSYADTVQRAKSEAAHAIRLCEPYKDKMAYPLFFDTEEPGTEDESRETACVFCREVTVAGFHAGIYASDYWWQTNLAGILDFVKWVARWSEHEPVTKGWKFWQFTDKGKVPGISGYVDVSYSRYSTDIQDAPQETTEVKNIDDLVAAVMRGEYGDGLDRQRRLGSDYYRVQLIVNKKVTGRWINVDAVAREVIAGKWGNGEDRKAALGTAYDVVQKRVNDILKQK